MDLPDYVQLSKWSVVRREHRRGDDRGRPLRRRWANHRRQAAKTDIRSVRRHLRSIHHRIDEPPLQLCPRGSHRHARRVRPGGQHVRRPDRRGGDVRDRDRLSRVSGRRRRPDRCRGHRRLRLDRTRRRAPFRATRQGVRDGQLLLVGVAAATIDYVYGRTIFAVLGLRYPPPEEAIAIYLLNTVGTVFLGSAVNMTHYRIWHRTQRQLFSIFETTPT